MNKEFISEFMSELQEIYNELKITQSGLTLDLENSKELLDKINEKIRIYYIKENNDEEIGLLYKEFDLLWDSKYKTDYEERNDIFELEEFLELLNKRLDNFLELKYSESLS